MVDQLQLLKVSVADVESFLNLVKEAIEVLVTGFESPKTFSILFIHLSLFRQYVNAIFGNEKLSKQRLSQRRGFGLMEELFTESLELNAFGLLQCKDFLLQIQELVIGEKKQLLFSLIITLLYQFELQDIDRALVSKAHTELICKRIELLFKVVSDKNVDETQAHAISFRNFWQVFRKRHGRHFVKVFLSSIMEELCSQKDAFEVFLASLQLDICIIYRQKSYKYSSLDMFSSFAKIKEQLNQYEYSSLKDLWRLRVQKGVAVDDPGDFMFESLQAIIFKAATANLKLDGVDIFPIFGDPDIAARYFSNLVDALWLKFHYFIAQFQEKKL